MKKFINLFLIVCMALGFIACASKPSGVPAASERKVPGSFPQFVKDALKKAPEDVLVGIGTAKLASLQQSRTVAATRARAEISRQMNTVIQDMVRDYQASSELDPGSALSFQENITVALSKSTLTGASVVEEDRDSEGNVWAVVMLSKTDVANEINQAAAAAKLAVPAAASFNAEARMNEAFKNILTEEVRAANRD